MEHLSAQVDQLLEDHYVADDDGEYGHESQWQHLLCKHGSAAAVPRHPVHWSSEETLRDAADVLHDAESLPRAWSPPVAPVFNSATLRFQGLVLEQSDDALSEARSLLNDWAQALPVAATSPKGSATDAQQDSPPINSTPAPNKVRALLDNIVEKAGSSAATRPKHNNTAAMIRARHEMAQERRTQLALEKQRRHALAAERERQRVQKTAVHAELTAKKARETRTDLESTQQIARQLEATVIADVEKQRKEARQRAAEHLKQQQEVLQATRKQLQQQLQAQAAREERLNTARAVAEERFALKSLATLQRVFYAWAHGLRHESRLVDRFATVRALKARAQTFHQWRETAASVRIRRDNARIAAVLRAQNEARALAERMHRHSVASNVFLSWFQAARIHAEKRRLAKLHSLRAQQMHEFLDRARTRIALEAREVEGERQILGYLASTAVSDAPSGPAPAEAPTEVPATAEATPHPAVPLQPVTPKRPVRSKKDQEWIERLQTREQERLERKQAAAERKRVRDEERAAAEQRCKDEERSKEQQRVEQALAARREQQRLEAEAAAQAAAQKELRRKMAADADAFHRRALLTRCGWARFRAGQRRLLELAATADSWARAQDLRVKMARWRRHAAKAAQCRAARLGELRQRIVGRSSGRHWHSYVERVKEDQVREWRRECLRERVKELLAQSALERRIQSEQIADQLVKEGFAVIEQALAAWLQDTPESRHRSKTLLNELLETHAVYEPDEAKRAAALLRLHRHSRELHRVLHRVVAWLLYEELAPALPALAEGTEERPWRSLDLPPHVREGLERICVHLHVALVLGPGDVQVWARYGECLERRGLVHAAATAYEQAVAREELGQTTQLGGGMRVALARDSLAFSAVKRLLVLHVLFGNKLPATRLAEQALAVQPEWPFGRAVAAWCRGAGELNLAIEGFPAADVGVAEDQLEIDAEQTLVVDPGDAAAYAKALLDAFERFGPSCALLLEWEAPQSRSLTPLVAAEDLEEASRKVEEPLEMPSRSSTASPASISAAAPSSAPQRELRRRSQRETAADAADGTVPEAADLPENVPPLPPFGSLFPGANVVEILEKDAPAVETAVARWTGILTDGTYRPPPTPMAVFEGRTKSAPVGNITGVFPAVRPSNELAWRPTAAVLLAQFIVDHCEHRALDAVIGEVWRARAADASVLIEMAGRARPERGAQMCESLLDHCQSQSDREFYAPVYAAWRRPLAVLGGENHRAVALLCAREAELDGRLVEAVEHAEMAGVADEWLDRLDGALFLAHVRQLEASSAVERLEKLLLPALLSIPHWDAGAGNWTVAGSFEPRAGAETAKSEIAVAFGPSGAHTRAAKRTLGMTRNADALRTFVWTRLSYDERRTLRAVLPEGDSERAFVGACAAIADLVDTWMRVDPAGMRMDHVSHVRGLLDEVFTAAEKRGGPLRLLLELPVEFRQCVLVRAIRLEALVGAAAAHAAAALDERASYRNRVGLRIREERRETLETTVQLSSELLSAAALAIAPISAANASAYVTLAARAHAQAARADVRGCCGRHGALMRHCIELVETAVAAGAPREALRISALQWFRCVTGLSLAALVPAAHATNAHNPAGTCELDARVAARVFPVLAVALRGQFAAGPTLVTSVLSISRDALRAIWRALPPPAARLVYAAECAIRKYMEAPLCVSLDATLACATAPLGVPAMSAADACAIGRTALELPRLLGRVLWLSVSTASRFRRPLAWYVLCREALLTAVALHPHDSESWYRLGCVNRELASLMRSGGSRQRSAAQTLDIYVYQRDAFRSFARAHGLVGEVENERRCWREVSLALHAMLAPPSRGEGVRVLAAGMPRLVAMDPVFGYSRRPRDPASRRQLLAECDRDDWDRDEPGDAPAGESIAGRRALRDDFVDILSFRAPRVVSAAAARVDSELIPALFSLARSCGERALEGAVGDSELEAAMEDLRAASL